MPIKVNLDEMLKLRGMTAKELSEIIDLTEANMSILRSGKAKAIRFETLSKICRALDCAPGEILQYEEGLDDEMDT